jgi:hypothetical protein
VRNHAWSVNAELDQICSSTPFRNHCEDSDTVVPHCKKGSQDMSKKAAFTQGKVGIF